MNRVARLLVGLVEWQAGANKNDLGVIPIARAALGDVNPFLGASQLGNVVLAEQVKAELGPVVDVLNFVELKA